MKMNFKKVLSIILATLLLASCMPMSVFAADAVATRTTTLDLGDLNEDAENAEEGWSWDFDSLTLTLNNVNFDTGDKDCINIGKKNVIFNLVGENNLKATGDYVLSDDYWTGGITVEGEGTLTVKGGVVAAINVLEMTINSGTLNVVDGQIWLLTNFFVNGGTVNVDSMNADTSFSEDIDGIYTYDKIEINGGVLNVKAPRCALMVTGGNEAGLGGIYFNGGDVTISGGMTAAYSGISYSKKDIFVNSTGTITIKDSPVGLYSGTGDVTVDKGTIYNVDNIAKEKLLRAPAGKVTVAPADYSAVDAALNAIPADFTNASLGATMALIDAKNAIVRGYDCYEQYKVDEMAGKLENAVNNVLDEIPDEPDEPVEEESWFARIFNAIFDFFKKIFGFLFGWISK